MKIGIDGNEANIEERVGIGEYAYQVIKQLANFQDRHQFTLFLKEKPRSDLPRESSNWRYVVFGPKHFWTQISLPFKLYFSYKLDLFFSPTHYAPRFSPIPRVIAIMDLSYIYYPHLFRKKDLIQLKSWTNYSLKKATRVITISQFSKKAIIDYYKIDPERIFVTYPGYKKEIYHPNYSQTEIEEIKRKYSLTDYLIFVGTIQPRKNILRLIEAFYQLCPIYPKLKLVLIGKKGWLYENILRTINHPKLKNKVLYLGYVEDKIIAKLYNGALAFVLPSLYEGFGLTVIEAMASGVPVIVSNTSSLPEIVGEAGVLVDPISPLSITEGILKIIRKDQRYFRENLIKKGLAQVKKFSWEICGLETVRILENI